MSDDLLPDPDPESSLGAANDETRPMRTPRRTTLGPFRLEEKIGEGGMGIVYRAHDPRLRRWVAIKRIHARYERDEAYNRLFLGEARAVAAVSHPNIAQIYSIHPGEGDEPSFFAMEYIEGLSTEARVRRDGPLPIALALEIGIQAARGLRAAHKVGIVHRDVKPSNLLLDGRNQLKLVDFGLAIQVGELATPQDVDEDEEHIHCTPHYVSPEQARGWRVDHRSDIYSLGCTLYFLLTGVEPFRAENRVDLFVAHANQPPTPPSAHRAEISPSLDALVLAMLEKRAEERPLGYDELLERFDAVLAELQPGKKRSRRTARPVAMVVALLALAGSGFGGWIASQGNSQEVPFLPERVFAGTYHADDGEERLHYDFTAPRAAEFLRKWFASYDVDLERAGTISPNIRGGALVWRNYDQEVPLPYLSEFREIELRGLLLLHKQHFRVRIGDDGTVGNEDGIDITLAVGGEPAHDRVVTHTFRGESHDVMTEPARLDFRVKSEEYLLGIVREPNPAPGRARFRFRLAQETPDGRQSEQASFHFEIAEELLPRGRIVISSTWPEENQNTVKIEQILVRGTLDRARLAHEQRMGAL